MALLRRDSAIDVVGEIAGSELVDAVKQLRPDVIALGMHLPSAGGFEATKEIMIRRRHRWSWFRTAMMPTRCRPRSPNAPARWRPMGRPIPPHNGRARRRRTASTSRRRGGRRWLSC